MNTFKSVKLVTLLSLAFIFNSNNAMAWGKNGHRIVGKIAENHMTQTTLTAVKALLDGERISEVGTWADEMRSNPSDFWQKKSPKWHYVNVNELSDFHPEHYSSDSEVSDAYVAIRRGIDILKNPASSIEDKKFYLKFLMHLVGDIHQPLHVGRADDRGGNRIKVKFFWEDTNLHTLWDSKLIEQEKLSFSEFAAYIDTNNQKEISNYLSSRPADWIKESFNHVQDVYNVDDTNFSYNYVYKYMPLVKQRLLQGGVRLAGLLNEIFDPKAVPGKNALN